MRTIHVDNIRLEVEGATWVKSGLHDSKGYYLGIGREDGSMDKYRNNHDGTYVVETEYPRTEDRTWDAYYPWLMEDAHIDGCCHVHYVEGAARRLCASVLIPASEVRAARVRVARKRKARVMLRKHGMEGAL